MVTKHTNKAWVGCHVRVKTKLGTYEGKLAEEHERNFGGCVDLHVWGQLFTLGQSNRVRPWKLGIKVVSIPARNILNVSLS